MEERGELCLAEEAARLRRSGMSVEEISHHMGVDAAWVEATVAPGEEAQQPDPDGARGPRPREANS